jgi:hypothetical protein
MPDALSLPMKKSLLAAIVGAAFFAAVSTFAADAAKTEAKEVTFVGKGQCAKCALHQTDECQNTVTVTENGKDQLYYLTANDVSEDFHKTICKGPKEIKVTGTVKEVGGKKEITPTKIELAKN